MTEINDPHNIVRYAFDWLSTYVTSFDWANIVSFFNNAFVGIIVGGALAIFGSYLVSRSERKLDRDQNRVSEIYKPLYDELMRNREFLAVNWPRYEEFMKCAEWESIKHSARLFKTPNDVRGAMEALHTSAKTFDEKAGVFDKEMENKVKDIFSQEINVAPDYGNFGSYVYLLLPFFKDKFDGIYSVFPRYYVDGLTSDKRVEMANTIIDQMTNMPSFLEIKELYFVWKEQEQSAVDCLQKRIEKFEKKFKA